MTQTESSPPGFRYPRIMYLICWMVRVDPEVLAECPTIDKFQVVSRAVLLSLVSGIAAIVWGSFLGNFWSPWIVACITALVVGLIFIVDQILGSAHWKLSGILRVPTDGGTIWDKLRAFGWVAVIVLACRLGFGLVTSFVTAEGATLSMLQESIGAQLEKDRAAENEKKRQAADSQKDIERARILTSVEAAVAQAIQEVAEIDKRLDAAKLARDAARRQAVAFKVEANCQILGNRVKGCAKGDGHLHQAAEMQRQKAEEDQRFVDGEIQSLERRRIVLAVNVESARVALAQRDREFQKITANIDDRVARELVQPHNDPLISYRALNAIFSSPKDGDIARGYWKKALGVLLMFEMLYVICCGLLEHASIYKVKLIARTKRQAAEEMAAHQQFHETLLAPRAPEHDRRPPPLRVIPHF